MTEAQFAVLAKGMKAVYADPKFLPDQDAIKVWYSLLKDIDYKDASKAISAIMRTSKFPPTVADITERVHADISADEMSELEAWGLIRRALRNSIYNSEKEFGRLPEICQKAVGSPANLREMAVMDEDTVESVQQSHFVRSYRALKAQKKQEELAHLPAFYRAAIEERQQGLLAEAT